MSYHWTTLVQIKKDRLQLTMEDIDAGETHYEKMVVINKIAMITFPIVAVTFNTIYFIAVFTTN